LPDAPVPARGEDDIEKQIAKAGFRLATLIKLAFQEAAPQFARNPRARR
jgi:hypothetical protein